VLKFLHPRRSVTDAVFGATGLTTCFTGPVIAVSIVSSLRLSNTSALLAPSCCTCCGRGHHRVLPAGHGGALARPAPGGADAPCSSCWPSVAGVSSSRASGTLYHHRAAGRGRASRRSPRHASTGLRVAGACPRWRASAGPGGARASVWPSTRLRGHAVGLYLGVSRSESLSIGPTIVQN